MKMPPPSAPDSLNLHSGALRDAIEKNEINDMRAALKAGADPSSLDFGDSRRRTLSHVAAELGRKEALALLVESGAVLDARDCFGQLPIDIALEFFSGADKEAFCIWMAEIMGSETVKSTRAVALAAERGFVRLIDTLAGFGYSVQSKGSLDHVGLAAPAWAGSLAGAKRLFELGAELEAVDDNGQAPLHIAIGRGNKEVACWLLSVGANPNLRQSSGATPLHRAMNRDEEDIVVALLRAGANPMIKNAYGKTAFEHAVECNCVRIMEMLETAGFGEVMDQERLDAYLVQAAKSGHGEMVGHLLCRGADPTVKSNGRSLLQHVRRDAAEVKQLILAARAGLIVKGALGDSSSGPDRPSRSHSLAV